LCSMARRRTALTKSCSRTSNSPSTEQAVSAQVSSRLEDSFSDGDRAGIYFSEQSQLASAYSRGSGQMLLSRLMLGKVYQVSTSGMLRVFDLAQLVIECLGAGEKVAGRPLKEGSNSHRSPCARELVIFDPDQGLETFFRAGCAPCLTCVTSGPAVLHCTHGYGCRAGARVCSVGVLTKDSV
jgi:hypothetical protein